jgi:hypothetical protein
MGFHKRHLPELEEMKRIHGECKDDLEFVKRVQGKSDAVCGSHDSVEYFHNIVVALIEKINNPPEPPTRPVSE